MKSSPNCPVLDSQSGNSGEFRHVSSDYRQVMYQGDRGNLQVIRPDHAAPPLEVVADARIDIGASIIKGQRNKFAQQALHTRFPLNRICIFLRPNEQLCPDRRTTGHFAKVFAAESIKKHAFAPLQNLDPHVAIKKVGHFHSFAGGNGSSSGRSNSMSAIQPMNSATSGIRRFISSMLGSCLGPSTSEIAARTRDSSTRAFSGSKRSKVRSNSMAIVLTPASCYGGMAISTSHFQTP